MQKKVFILPFSLLLAGIILITSVGVTFDMHLCGDKVKSISVFKKASTCNIMTTGAKVEDCSTDATSKSDKTTTSITERSCCSNLTIFCQNDVLEHKNLVEANAPLNFTFQIPVTSSIQATNLYTYFKNWQPLELPPLLIKDYMSLYQTFRI